MQPERWVVVGSSGFVGRHVLDALRHAGCDVRGVAAPRLTAPVDADTAQLVALAARTAGQVPTTAQDLSGADVVVNCAGLAAPDAGLTPELMGANALLPAVLAELTPRGARFVHLSSAAVQGNRDRLDETSDTTPGSPYALTKARGEAALLASTGAHPATVVIRATSVQGPERPTTQRLQRLARSAFATVAAPGDRPTPVTSVAALAQLVHTVGRHPGELPQIVLQPWEGLTTTGVLRAASGGRAPRVLPAGLCRASVRVGYLLSRLLGGRLVGAVRRVEVMWFGQDQVDGWCARQGIALEPRVVEALSPGGDPA